jgi:hypothetical protein
MEPILRVVRGEPTDEELAALVAALAVVKPAESPRPARRCAWSDRSAALRKPLHPGPAAWRNSALP